MKQTVDFLEHKKLLFLFRAPFPSSAELAKSRRLRQLRLCEFAPLGPPAVPAARGSHSFPDCCCSLRLLCSFSTFSSLHPSPSSVFFPSHISQLPNPIHILYKSYTTPLHILYNSYTHPTQIIYNSYTNPKQQLDTSYINPIQAPHISYTQPSTA